METKEDGNDIIEPIKQPSKSNDNIETDELKLRKSKLKTIGEINDLGVLNNDTFVDRCHHGIPTNEKCSTCILDESTPPKSPIEKKEDQKVVDDVFGEDELPSTKPSTSVSKVEHSGVSRTIDKEQILSNLLQQQHELGLQATVQYEFQNELIAKYNGINGITKNDNSYRQPQSSHTMNGLIENIQRGFTEGLAFRKEQARINMDLLKVLESMKDIKDEDKLNEIVASVIQSISKSNKK